LWFFLVRGICEIRPFCYFYLRIHAQYIMEKLYELFRKSSGVTTDSRRVERNNIYFALRGENFDGNMFAAQALAQGALAAVVDDAACGGFCLLVLDID